MERHLLKLDTAGVDAGGRKWACGFGRCSAPATSMYVYYSIGPKRGEVLTNHTGVCDRCKAARLDKLSVPVRPEGDELK